MPNLDTPLDQLGALIDPRKEGETLVAYKNRLAEVAGASMERDLTPKPGRREWVEAREQELEGRLGYPVRLKNGSNDRRLNQQAEERLLTYSDLQDQEEPFRVPPMRPRGEDTYFGFSETTKGGVASPSSMELQERGGRVYARAGYVSAHNRLWYVPSRMRTWSLRLPPETTETVIVPWQIDAEHGHRIMPEGEHQVRMVGEDGHTHFIELQEGQPVQTGYKHDSRAEHAHPIEVVGAVDGPAFAATRPYGPSVGQGDETSGLELGHTSGLPSHKSPVEVPMLGPQVAETVSDETGHVHKVRLSPHQYWSGTFVLPGEDHSHRVEEWVVQDAKGHNHTLPRPEAPSARALVPRLVGHEGDRLAATSMSPYAMDLRVEDGWTIARCDSPNDIDTFSTELVLSAETGIWRELPEVPTQGILGLGLDLPTDRVRVETDRRPGYLTVEAEAIDEDGGLVAGEELTISWTWEGDPHSSSKKTDENGRAVFQLNYNATEPNGTITLTVEAEAGPSTSIAVDLDTALAELDGYGVDYGSNYGN